MGRERQSSVPGRRCPQGRSRGHRELDLQPLPCKTSVSVTPEGVTACSGNSSVIQAPAQS